MGRGLIGCKTHSGRGDQGPLKPAPCRVGKAQPFAAFLTWLNPIGFGLYFKGAQDTPEGE